MFAVFVTVCTGLVLGITGWATERWALWDPWTGTLIDRLFITSEVSGLLTRILSLELSLFDVGMVSIFYQVTLYLLIRMARGGFTLGEAGLVAQTATVLLLETVNLTKFKVRPSAFIIALVQIPHPRIRYGPKLPNSSPHSASRVLYSSINSP